MYIINYVITGISAALLISCSAIPEKKQENVAYKLPSEKTFPPPTDYVPIGQVKIQSHFPSIKLTKENFASEVHNCVPQYDIAEEYIQKFPSDHIVTFGNLSSAKSFMFYQTSAICLQHSSEKFPIFAAETFNNTVNPKDVPADVIDGWYKQVALLVATKGIAKIAYDCSVNGSVDIATYWVEKDSNDLHYSHFFKEKGAWEMEIFDARFPVTTCVVDISKRSGVFIKSFPLLHLDEKTASEQSSDIKLPPPADSVPIEQVKIQSRFPPINLSKKNFAFEVHKCIPQYDVKGKYLKKHLKEFPNESIVAFSHGESAKSFIYHQTSAICLQHSSETFPIFAAETFTNTISPHGVPAKIVDGWYKQIALLIATKGIAKIAYERSENGSADIATYWVEKDSNNLHYSRAIKEKGAWETEIFDARFSHPALASTSETKYAHSNTAGVKIYPLAHRFR